MIVAAARRVRFTRGTQLRLPNHVVPCPPVHRKKMGSRADGWFSLRFSHAYNLYGIPSARRLSDGVAGSCSRVPTLVMIVDDHAVIRRMVRALLEAESLTVSDAVDGAEGVRKAQAEKPDLVILDLSMPVMKGLEAARKLKLLFPTIPLLMFTNNAGGVMEKEARAAGISSVISKCDSDGAKQLLARVKELLRLNEADVPRAS